MAFNLETCARPNILKLQPYRCARDDYEDNGTNILLDANENTYGPGLELSPIYSPKRLPNGNFNGNSNGTLHAHDLPQDLNLDGLNRYPDPHQQPLKTLLSTLRSPPSNPSLLTPSNFFCGVGSDEAIDTIMRVFCRPSASSILITPPTYGMYSVSAHVNDLSIVSVPLLLPSFTPDVSAILSTLSADPSIKLVFLCSPGNPTGALIPRTDVEAILAHPTWNGVVIVDEAYIDFASASLDPCTRLVESSMTPSLAPLVPSYSNLVVLGTLSKAHGLAGLRLGFAIGSPPVIQLMNNMKAPYNISSTTSQLANIALQPASLSKARDSIARLKEQRERLVRELPRIPGLGQIIGGLEANFVMVQVLDRLERGQGRVSNVAALRVYERLAGGKGVVVRFRGREYGCEGCLRVTVGTAKEVETFLKEARDVLEEVLGEVAREKHGGRGAVKEGSEEIKKEVHESEIIA